MTGFANSDECPITQPSSSRRRAMQAEPKVQEPGVRQIPRGERYFIKAMSFAVRLVGPDRFAVYMRMFAPPSVRRALHEEFGGVE